MWGQAWGWLATGAVSGLALIGGSIVAVVNDAFKSWLKGLPGRLLFACGGERRFLDRYADELHARHHEVPIPFAVPSGPDVKISVASVYVPLRAVEGISSRSPAGAEALGWEAVDALLADGKKVIVCGDPGAGKSMYLRRAVLAWTESRRAADAGARERRGRGRGRRGQRREALPERVPVLLELHELKPDALRPDALDVVALLAQHFAGPAGRNVPRRWIERQLLAGRATLYLDGLDEVPAAERHDVVHWIKGVARKYPKAGMLVTCRTAVYPAHREHLKETVDRSLAIQEFTDLHIHQFLRGWRWPEQTAQTSVDRLLKALGETPRLMSLARNPLLLTAIAYLYSYVYPHTDKELPRTRAEFYQQVSDAFVDDRGRQGEFGSELKRAVLCNAGLKAQDALAESGDRRSADEGVGREFSDGVLMEWVAQALECQHETPDKARRVIDEICVRSGLLSRIENGRYYQFAHISLQEYLAAEALADDWDALLTRYDADPERWRETVRLWCGVTRRDCSPMIRDLRARDLLLSFQCLAEARHADGALIREMVHDAGARLGLGDVSKASALEAALGVAATGPASMSDPVFALLEPTATDRTAPELVRDAAIRALAATVSPRAARCLAPLLDHHTSASAALVSMGDIAVPALGEVAMSGSLRAVDALGTVGTGRAAVALAVVMATESDVEVTLRGRCAVLLGGLVAEPEVEEALREARRQILDQLMPVSLLERLSGDPRVWVPFAQGADDPIIPVMGVVVALVGRAFEEGELPVEAGLDARLVAALLLPVSGVRGELIPLTGSEHLEELVGWLGYAPSSFGLDLRYTHEVPHSVYGSLGRVLVDGSFVQAGAHDDLYRLYRRAMTSAGDAAAGTLRLMDELPVTERLRTLGVWWLGKRVPPDVWETCAEPPLDADFDFEESWHYRLVFGLLLVVSAVAGVRAVLTALMVDGWGPWWLGWAALGAIIFGWLALWLGQTYDDREELLLATIPFASSYGYGAPMDAEDWRQQISGLVFLPATALYSFVGWSGWWGTTTAIVLSVAVVAVGVAAVLSGTARDRRARQARDTPRRAAHEVVTALRRPAGTAAAE
ncbi:NACHT domain-containing protein [Streptomyces sp. NPDC048436]|uniref:NACHT domain-containing protein n=1 Tax=Streptomyces sp. NPDC048436 TaxID=3365550 RepID=UPI00371656A9